MKRTISIFILTVIGVLFLTACWNPSVPEVPLTEPWDKMNLPIDNNARVWTSNDEILKVFHRTSDKDTLTKAYMAVLEKDGWKITKMAVLRERGWQITSERQWGWDRPYKYEYQKSGQKIVLYVYDADNTGVIIETCSGAKIVKPMTCFEAD